MQSIQMQSFDELSIEYIYPAITYFGKRIFNESHDNETEEVSGPCNYRNE